MTAENGQFEQDLSSLPLFSKGVSLLCWAYNEEELISLFLKKADKLLSENVLDYEIVIIDDCSTDRTNELIRAEQITNPRIMLYRNDSNLNVGLSFTKAIREASKEYLFWQTIDWSYDISNMRFFLGLLNEYDIVAGVRMNPVQVADNQHQRLIAFLKMFQIDHITKRSDTIRQAIISVLNYQLIRVLFRVPISDYQNVCFYKSDRLKNIKFESKSSFANPEHLIKSYWNGAKIREVPISFIPRKLGQSKGAKPKAIINAISDILKLWFKWVILNQRQPVLFGEIDKIDE